MTLGCRVFFYEFLAQFEKEKEKVNWEEIWYKSKTWTAKMLGTGPSRKKGDYGIIGRIGQKFGYETTAEWKKIDQVWSFYLPRPKNWENTPWRNDVVIEHENSPANLEYTFFKFEEISAPLKVGIFYPEEEYEQDSLSRCREMILKQVSSYPGGVYLIIFGFLNEKKGVYWHGYEIDFKGNVIQLHNSLEEEKQKPVAV